MLTLLPIRTETFDHAAARREGWDVFDYGPDADGRAQVRLGRMDTPEDGQPPFPNDCDAWQHVVARARAGSALHQAALAAADDIERMLIEAAYGAW